MQILLCQLAIENLAPEKNRARVLEHLRGIKFHPPSLLILPELFSLGTLSEGFDPEKAESIRLEDQDFLAKLSSENGIHVIGSSIGFQGNTLQNESLHFDSAGKLRGSYRKIHPFTLGGEDLIFNSGTEIVTWELGGFAVQPAICYDLRFPEIFRAGLRRGATFIVVQANWPESRQAHWEILLRARAIENQCYVAGVNCLGMQRGTRYAGGSLLITPKGEIVVSAGSEEGLFTAETDPQTVFAWRKSFPALTDRKPLGFWA